MTVNRTQIEENQVQGNTFLQVGNNLSDVASQQTALNNITGISSNTNGYVLTNDIDNTGNAVFMPPAYVAGDGGVATDTTLAGDGSSGNPLGIAPLEARRYVADPESIGVGGVGIGEAVFQNGWNNLGNTFANVAFYKDNQGIIHLEGSASGGVSDQPIFTLPEGYRPTTGTLGFAAGLGNGWNFIWVYISTDGTVRSGSNGSLTNQVALDGITFLP